MTFALGSLLGIGVGCLVVVGLAEWWEARQTGREPKYLTDPPRPFGVGERR